MSEAWQDLELHLEVTPKDGGAPVGILGVSNYLRIKRESLNTSTVAVSVLDSEMDPSGFGDESGLLLPGGTIRATALDQPGGVRDAIFTGTIREAHVSWDDKGRDWDSPGTWFDTKTSRIDIEAVARSTPLSTMGEPRSVAFVDDLRYILADHPDVPFLINGTTGYKASGDVVAYNKSASMLEQATLTRDSERSKVWVDRHNVLNASDATQEHNPYVTVLDVESDVQDATRWSVENGSMTTGVSYDNEACSKITPDGTGIPRLISEPIMLDPTRDLSIAIRFHLTTRVKRLSFVQLFDAADNLLLDTYISNPADPAWFYNDPDLWYGAYRTGTGQTVEGWDRNPVDHFRFGLAVDAGTDAWYVSHATASQYSYSVTDAEVSELGAGFDTDHLVNIVNLTLRHLDGTGETIDEKYGPYVNQESIDKWGPHSEDYTVTPWDSHAFPNALDWQEWADNAGPLYLTGTDPVVSAQSVTVPIEAGQYRRSRLIHADLESQWVINVGQVATAGILEGLDHDITPDGWLMTMRFRNVAGNPPATKTSAIAQDGTRSDLTGFLAAARQLLTASGALTVTASGVSWTDRLTVLGAGRATDSAPSGYFEIAMPANGIEIEAHNTGSGSVNVTGGQVPLGNWETLWYRLPVGKGYATVTGSFVVTGYSNAGEQYGVPRDAVLIATRNGDTGAVKWGTGSTDTGWIELIARHGYAFRSGYAHHARILNGTLHVTAQFDTAVGAGWGSTSGLCNLPNGWVFPYQVEAHQQGSTDWLIYSSSGTMWLNTYGGPATAPFATFTGTFGMGAP
ncbi:MAG: hypothetical protein ACRDQA_23695 [Nocardioidaceae bacterium]